ncbi:testicular haploid expressed gene protein [Cebus imitator]|uniref:testicular haploid expressed gene protein n=1 Tax=Cebus imitator TaxID=2715852 RepID=UPI001898945B|nr:testicular haploid expressed gene protein [Cebus imitator]
MGEPRQGRGSLGSQHSEAGGGLEKEPDGDPRGLQSSVYGSRRVTDPRLQDLGHAELGPEDPEEELPPEEGAGEELPETLEPKDALSELERVLDHDAEEDIPEMSRLSISQKIPGTAVARAKKKRRRWRPSELAEPKRNWQVLKDRKGCRCGGYAWISPCQTSLQFCLYWPSVYWTERFLEDTTLTITVPEVSRRMEELSRPRRFYLEYYNSNRGGEGPGLALDSLRSDGAGPLPVPGLLGPRQPHSRLWKAGVEAARERGSQCRCCTCSDAVTTVVTVSRVSRAAQMAVPSSRILQLSKPRAPATLLEEWDPMPKPKPRVSDYNRLLHLAMPKAQSDKCVPDRDPRWAVLDVTKRVVASPRIISLARPKVRKGFNEGYDRRPLASMSSPPPKASPEKCEPPQAQPLRHRLPVNTLRHPNPVYVFVLSLLAWRREACCHQHLTLLAP